MKPHWNLTPLRFSNFINAFQISSFQRALSVITRLVLIGSWEMACGYGRAGSSHRPVAQQGLSVRSESWKKYYPAESPTQTRPSELRLAIV